MSQELSKLTFRGCLSIMALNKILQGIHGKKYGNVVSACSAYRCHHSGHLQFLSGTRDTNDIDVSGHCLTPAVPRCYEAALAFSDKENLVSVAYRGQHCVLQPCSQNLHHKE